MTFSLSAQARRSLVDIRGVEGRWTVTGDKM